MSLLLQTLWSVISRWELARARFDGSMRCLDSVARDVQGLVSTSSTKYYVTPIHEHDGSILHFPVSQDAIISQAAIKRVCSTCESLGTVYKSQMDFSRSRLSVFVIYSGAIPEQVRKPFKPRSIDLSWIDSCDVENVRLAIEHIFLSSDDGVLPSIELETGDGCYKVCATGLRTVSHPIRSTFDDIEYDFTISETRVSVEQNNNERPSKRQKR